MVEISNQAIFDLLMRFSSDTNDSISQLREEIQKLQSTDREERRSIENRLRSVEQEHYSFLNVRDDVKSIKDKMQSFALKTDIEKLELDLTGTVKKKSFTLVNRVWENALTTFIGVCFLGAAWALTGRWPAVAEFFSNKASH
jgi:hypothetical protein